MSESVKRILDFLEVVQDFKIKNMFGNEENINLVKIITKRITLFSIY